VCRGSLVSSTKRSHFSANSRYCADAFIGKQTACHDGPFLGRGSDVHGTTLLLVPLPPLGSLKKFTAGGSKPQQVTCFARVAPSSVVEDGGACIRLRQPDHRRRRASILQ
jgi:hypothetical protein